MNGSNDLPAHGAAAAPAAVRAPGAQAAANRLEALFRVWNRSGHVHPLLHIVRRYREEREP